MEAPPKVVNVIPKSSSPVQRTPPPEVTATPTSSITELKVDIKSYTTKNSSEDSSSGLVRATSSKVEVLQSCLPQHTSKEWECHLCTLLNPDLSNICAVCATVRVKKPTSSKKPAPPRPPQPTYLQLVNLDSTDLVPNADAFECLVCFLEIAPGKGVTLRECLHQFCRDCLGRTVEYADEAEVKCPYRDDNYSCEIALQEREIKALVTKEVYEQHLAKSVAMAENRMEKTFHCKTPDCKGWCIFEDNVNDFRCPVCRKTNCLTCQVSTQVNLNVELILIHYRQFTWVLTVNNTNNVWKMNAT